MYVCVLHESLVPVEVRRGHQIPRDWSYRRLLAGRRALGIEPEEKPGLLTLQSCPLLLFFLLELPSILSTVLQPAPACLLILGGCLSWFFSSSVILVCSILNLISEVEFQPSVGCELKIGPFS